MKLIKTIIRFFTTASVDKPFSVLGRWQIDYNHKIINRKIDLANYDNCGTCKVHKNELVIVTKLN